MDLDKAYLFCIRCGHKVKQEEKAVLICTHCHYKNYISPSACNAAIIKNEQDQILLVRRARDPHKGKWDLPGGFILPGEDYATSLKREITEELGCTIAIGRIIGAYHDEYLYQDVLIPTLGIVAICKLTSTNLNPTDDIDMYKFFSKEDVLNQDIAFDSIKQALKEYFSS